MIDIDCNYVLFECSTTVSPATWGGTFSFHLEKYREISHDLG